MCVWDFSDNSTSSVLITIPNIQHNVYIQKSGYVQFSHCLLECDRNAMHTLRFYLINKTFYLSNLKKTKQFRTVYIQTPLSW